MSKRKPATKRKAKARPKKPAAPKRVVIPSSQRELLVTTNEQVAMVLGVDWRTVQKLKRKAGWPGPKRGPHDLAAIADWNARRKATAPDASQNPHRQRMLELELEKAEEAVRWRRARRRQEEADAQNKLKELVPAAEVAEWFPRVFAPLATYLHALVRRHPKERKEVAKIIAEVKRNWQERQPEST